MMKNFLERVLLMAMLPAAVLFLACPTSMVHAAIVWSGDVYPAEPATWTIDTIGYIGKPSMGTITVDGGSNLQSKTVYISSSLGSNGAATITGAGSMWTNSSNLYVGHDGRGMLTVDNGGIVSTGMLFASLNDLFGNGTISAKDAVLDGDIVFDATQGSTPTIAFGTGGKLNLSTDGSGALGAGYNDSGNVRIANGIVVASSYGYLGYNYGCIGTATVTGIGSKWTNSSDFYVGRNGRGTLRIEAGGQISNTTGHVGTNSTATVSGIGSKWINSGPLYIDNTLIIEAGGQVSDTIGWLYSNTATVTGTGSTWTNSNYLRLVNASSRLIVADGGMVTAGTLYASLSGLMGDGTITTKGAVLDADFVFDGSHGTQSSFAFGTGGTLNLILDGSGVLGAGYFGSGTLRIADGVAVASSFGFLGYSNGSIGTATVTGIGSKWTNSSTLDVGYSFSRGTLLIEDGGQVSNTAGYLGYNSGCIGTATVTGIGSKWTNSGTLYVGKYGNGTLNIEAGGQVKSASGYISNGTVTVTDINSKWTNSSNLYVGGYYGGGSGTLNIEAGGQVSNGTSYLGNDSGSIGMVMVTGIGSKWTNSGALYVGGYYGNHGSGSGTLSIEAGGQVSSGNGLLGYNSGSIGMVTVTGAGSLWSLGALYMDWSGKGTLNIEAGGQVKSDYVYLGSNNTATITGVGSKWINNMIFNIQDSGTLNILGGGEVAASSVTINFTSLLAIDVGTGSKLTITPSYNSIANNGKVRILAGANTVENDIHAPISAIWGAYSTGTVQAVGGTWNTTTHEFTVSGVQPGDSGVPVSVDLLSTQRLLIDDSNTGWTLGASFAASASSKTLTLTATAIGGGTLTALENLAGPGQTVLGGWSLSAASGYAAGDPAYLSFESGGRYSREFVQLWSYNGTAWTKFAASDLNYDGTYVNFTATSLSTYAVTVPEPGMAVLLACGLMGLAVWRKRRNRSLPPPNSTINTTRMMY